MKTMFLQPVVVVGDDYEVVVGIYNEALECLEDPSILGVMTPGEQLDWAERLCRVGERLWPSDPWTLTKSLEVVQEARIDLLDLLNEVAPEGWVFGEADVEAPAYGWFNTEGDFMDVEADAEADTVVSEAA